jgi:hypothetical protein
LGWKSRFCFSIDFRLSHSKEKSDAKRNRKKNENGSKEQAIALKKILSKNGGKESPSTQLTPFP